MSVVHLQPFKYIVMKNFFILLSVLFSSAAFGQNKECHNLWLGGTYDSTEKIRQITEQYLQTQLQLTNNEGSKTVYELKDKEDITDLKIWMKQKRSVVGSDVTIIYQISSFKVVGPAERIESLFNALKQKVSGCSTATSDLSVSYATGKITVEKQGGDWSKKNIPMWTLTVTSTK